MKHAISVYWKESGKQEVYSQLPAFLERHPGYSEDTINNYISRKGVPFKTETFTLVRTEVIKRLKP